MTYGPIDLIAVEFPGNRFKMEILPELFELVEKEIIRIIDLVIIMKDQGEVIVGELRLDAARMAMFDPLQADVSQMITDSDIKMIAEQLAENSTAGIMLIENLWAKKTSRPCWTPTAGWCCSSASRMTSWKKRWPTSPRSPWRRATDGISAVGRPRLRPENSV